MARKQTGEHIIGNKEIAYVEQICCFFHLKSDISYAHFFNNKVCTMHDLQKPFKRLIKHGTKGLMLTM